MVLAPYLAPDTVGTAPADRARLAVLASRVAGELGEPEEQLASAQRAIEIAEGEERAGLEAAARLLESAALHTLGREDNGLAAAERALALYEEQGSASGRIRALRDLASLHSEVEGRPDLASQEYEEALAIARRIGDRASEAALLVRYSSDSFIAGDLDRAERQLLEAQAIYREIGYEQELATVLGNRGILHLQRDEFAAAEESFERALELRRAGPPSGRSALLNNVAGLYARRGESRRARDSWERAAEVSAEGGDLLWELLANINLTQLDLLEGDLGAAERRLEETIEPRLEALRTPVVTSEVLRLRADVEAEGDRETEAIAALNEAIEILESFDERSRLARAHQQLAGLHVRYGRYEAAESLARQGIAELTASGQRGAAARGHYYLLRALLAQGRVEEARRALDPLVEELPATDVQRRLLATLGRGRVLLAEGDAERAMEEMEAGLAAAPVGYLVPLRLEAELLLAEAEEALGRSRPAAERRGGVAAAAERDGFLYTARLAATAATRDTTTDEERPAWDEP